MRMYTLDIRFTDSPNPWIIENVRHIQTEGGLLRLIVGETTESRKSIWIPLCQVHQIAEVDRSEGPR